MLSFIVQYRVRLDPATAPYVHHIVLIECVLPPSMHDFFEDYAKNHPGSKCYRSVACQLVGIREVLGL